MSETTRKLDRQEAIDPLQESKKDLHYASDALRIALQLKTDFPEDGLINNKCAITKCESPKDSAQNGVTFKITLKEKEESPDGGLVARFKNVQTSICTIESKAVRCGNANDTEVHVFDSGITISMINGRDIVKIDDGDAVTVEAGKRCEYNTQEHYRLKPEDFLAQETVGWRSKIEAILSWRPNIIGRMSGNEKKKESPKLPAPTGEYIEATLVPKEEVDKLLNGYTDAMLQAAATMLCTDLDGLKTQVAEYKMQAAQAADNKKAEEDAAKKIALEAHLCVETIADQFAAETAKGDKSPKPTAAQLSDAKNAAVEAYINSIKQSADDTNAAKQAAVTAYATIMDDAEKRAKDAKK